MRKKCCKNCGATYYSKKQGAYLCPACSKKAKKESVLKERTCIDCGITFIGYPKSKRCHDCQTLKNKESKKALQKNGPQRKIGTLDVCACCGSEYTVNSGTQKYCKDCAQKATLQNIRNHKREYVKQNAEKYAIQKAKNNSYNKICLICGKIFNSKTPTVTCSTDCAKKLKILRQQEADYARGKRKTLPGISYNSGLPKSGIVGITARRNGKWQATYKRHYIGVYNTIQEAEKAINQYKKEIT